MTNIALFLTSELMVIGTKKFKPIDTFINFKKGTVNINQDAYLYKIKNDKVFAYIYANDKLILIDTKIKDDKFESARLVSLKEKMEHGDLHFLVAESIIGQLARLAVMGLKTNWLLIILALGAGLGIGYIACSAINPSHVTQVYNSTLTPIPTILR